MTLPTQAVITRCPTCHRDSLERDPANGSLQCFNCQERFERSEGVLAFMRDFDDYTENYDQICQDDLSAAKTPDVVKRVFTELVKARAKGLVCDIGCGDGYVINSLNVAGRIAVDIAHAYLKRLPDSITRIWSRAENLPIQSGSIDTIVCTDVLEHVLEAESLVAEFDRILKPDGTILLAFPFEQDLSVYDLPEYKAKYAKYKYVHLRSIDDEMIARLFPGFKIAHSHLITEGMALMEFKPYPIKFVEMIRR